jgi:hypothetical protein
VHANKNGTTPAKTLPLHPMPCPTPCRARVQSKYFMINLLCRTYFVGEIESQRWKPQVDYSSAPVAGCKSISVAAVTVAKPIVPMAAPKRRVTSHYGQQAIVINKAVEAV